MAAEGPPATAVRGCGMTRRTWAVILLAATTVALAADPPRTAPLTPEQARAAFQVAPGLRVELAAAEPQVESPVAMAFDEDGRMWVVEMLDYPNGPAAGQPPE